MCKIPCDALACSGRKLKLDGHSSVVCLRHEFGFKLWSKKDYSGHKNSKRA